MLVAIYCHLTFTRKSILRYLSKVCVKQLINRVCLEAYNKSGIKQLGTCHLTVGHGKSAKVCHFYIVPDYCRLILGLNDIHSLSLIVIKCDVTDKWSANNLRPMGSASIVYAVEEQSGSVLSKERIVNGRFKKIFSVWDISQLSLWTLSYQRTMNQWKSLHIECQ